MLQRTSGKDQGAPALAIRVEPGLAPEIDTVAEAADARHSFLRRAWFAGAGGAGAATLVARRGCGAPVAALPIARSGSGPLRLRAVPGIYWPFRSFPVAADAADAELLALLSHRAAPGALGRLWRLGPVYEADPSADRLSQIAASACWTVLRRRLSTSYRLDLEALLAEGSWPRSSTLRKNRWIERRLAELGELDWKVVTGAGWTAAAFDDLAEIERNSWVVKETGGKDAKFAAPENRRFWENAVRDPVLAGTMSAAMLYIGGTPAAFAFSIQAGRTRYYLANSYDERFAKHSLGRALLYRDFQDAIGAGVREIGWGAGDPGYKTDMGAVPGPAIVDLLFVRSRALAALLRPFWERRAR